ncbi:MAG: LysR substrate-binding domain-containing protein [Verrucomicrobiota bacterium]|nr:LysR substrate-binding domain-containing protein [Verrucomicrobiota bacterium]
MQEPYEIRQLRYFLEVADAGNFSRAAKRLGVSQPAVSQQMKDLEAGLRAILFQRRGKRISLTSAGLVFQEHARAILHQVEKSLQEIGSEPGELRGTLRLGIIPYLSGALLPKLLGPFFEQHPGIDLSIREISSTDIETGLEEGQMDLGLGWVTRHSPNLRYEHLGDDEFTVAVPEGHPWARRRVIRLGELHRQRIVQLPDTYVMRRMTDEICRNHRIRPRTVAEINSMEAVLRALEPLKAVALTPTIALRGSGDLHVKAVRLEGERFGLEIGLLRLVDSGTNPAVAAFGKIARAVVPRIIEG